MNKTLNELITEYENNILNITNDSIKNGIPLEVAKLTLDNISSKIEALLLKQCLEMYKSKEKGDENDEE